MTPKKWGAVGLGVVLLALYNGSQPDLIRMRTNPNMVPGTHKHERYGPSMVWLDRVAGGSPGDPNFKKETTLNFNVLSSMMIAGLASGFRSQVANLLWMKSDEYWHKGMLTRQIPLMEAVVTLDPQFIDAWRTAGWHWAYNIYADLPDRADLKHNPIKLRREQLHCIAVGLNYLDRGADANPDTYRLWFEDGWTRSEKGGNMDDRTITLFREARRKADARELEKTVAAASGKSSHIEKVQGSDLVGRTIGHIYEKRPDIDLALQQYSIMLANGQYEATTHKTANPDSTKPLAPAEEALLRDCGRYWGRYGKDYDQIVLIYKDADSVIKGQIKALIPDIDRMVAAQAMREKMQGYDSQPTGAYISIAARYVPSWNLYKAGKLDEAIATIIGVMNANTKYHLQGLPITARIFAMRGDGPGVIKTELDAAKEFEKSSSQEIGLHFLAKLYAAQAAKATDPVHRNEWLKLEYRTWYRGRMRNSLDYYSMVNTYRMEDKYHFKPPTDIIAAIKESRKSNSGVNAAPEAPPNVSQYQAPGA